MSTIILSTLNARYIHSSLGLRYIRANMKELQGHTRISEYIINSRPIDIAESLIADKPTIIGFGVYIWNIEETTQLVAMLKTIAPQITIILGGPEVSFEHDQQTIVSLADYVICGMADLEFYELSKRILSGDKPGNKIIQAKPVPPPFITLPYEQYNDDDVKNRVIYIEASRGCPFKCEFCLSALDKTATPFDIDEFLGEMDKLYQRGVRHFKFVDRTFNLKIQTSIRIMEFFLQRLDDKLFLHFELIPDHLPEKLKSVIERFPEGSLQFEIGIQTLNSDIQKLISRKQNNEKSKENIAWLMEKTHAHLHTDLILGLPGETIESIAHGFNELVKLNPHEIQIGILKRLRGTPIIRHTETYDMRFNPHPPYNILSNNCIDFPTMQRLNRFARYWDMIANSGRFTHTKSIILSDSPFENFIALSDWIFKTAGQTHKISLPRLFEIIYQALIECFNMKHNVIKSALWKDYLSSGLKGYPNFADEEMIRERNENAKTRKSSVLNRQARHIG